ncbi:glycosyltransferase family 2 protein [Cyanobium sp. CH-040]|uniref:glycosyltransferase family 2 protein n=1 Tax=Cyanobium sp. CH-040 TaxID=2823708 RepID=UPI0020CE8762|nr:glycosyltransferase family 2 protein [Cyanobium sp. CH-040]MCP9927910.1 glycosyltransferase [Cyanobium sp. CH-040]
MKISIITPSLNAKPWIRACVESVAMQNVPDLEHIVIDGGSSDGTLDELSKLALEYPHLSWQSSKDKGQSDAMNLGFSDSTGLIIGFLNSDDFLADRALPSVLETFESNPDVDIVVGNLAIVNGEDEILLQSSVRMIDLLFCQSFKWPLNPSCYFYKRQVQEALGPFPIDEHFVMDYWFLLRPYRDFRRIRIDRLLGYFRCHDHNKSRVDRSIRDRLESRRREFLLERESLRWLLLWRLLSTASAAKAATLRLLYYCKESLASMSS